MSQQSRRPITPEDIYLLKTVSDAQLSPDGARVAFVQTRIDREADTYRSSVWVAPTADGDAVQFTHGAKSDTAPRWSPDGRWLAFLSDREGDKAQLYVMPANGGEARRITNLPNGAGAAVWAPDGGSILFAARVLKEPAPTDAEARKRWDRRPKAVDHLHYKDDGQGYTYDGASQLFVVPTEGGEPKQLTKTARDNRAPCFSPDGARIAFARLREGAADYNLTDIWVMDADGSNARQLTDTIGRPTSPTWSPDGTLIACYGTEQQEEGLGDSVVHVWVVPVQGSAPRALSARLDRGTMLLAPPAVTPGPVWAVDGQSVCAGIADAGNLHAYRFGLADGGAERVIGGERQLTSIGFNPRAGKIAFVATAPDNPGDVFCCDYDGGNEKRLTRINAAVLSELAMPRIERRTFSNPNGGQMDAWVVHPLNASGAAPLLVDIHGGPHSFHGNNFMAGYFYRYALPARGWAVLLLNPTGSGSYGKALADGIRGRWGEHDLPEQFAAVDTLVTEGIADGARLAVTGYSYGGFMTSWTIGHTDRFKAAIVGAPVVNMESFFGTSDIGMWFAKWEMCADYYATREVFRRLSPINYVDRVTTPTLIVHGEGDDRCPIGQGEELYTGLVSRGKVPVRFVRYPGGSHLFIVTGTPSHRVDYWKRLMEWVEKYV